MNLSKTSLNKMSVIITNIVETYLQCKTYLSRHNSLSSSDYDNSIFTSFIKRVDDAYKALIDDEKDVIANDFFDGTQQTWWNKHYSPRMYRQLRNKAIRHFLREFNEK